MPGTGQPLLEAGSRSSRPPAPIAAADEFFKDETTRRCKNCGHKIVNPRMDFGCAAYCKLRRAVPGRSAAGTAGPEGGSAEGPGGHRDEALLQHRISSASAMPPRWPAMPSRSAKEEKGNPAVVLSAAYLHDIGIQEAERKYQSTAARYQEEEGPPIAREILTRLGRSRRSDRGGLRYRRPSPSSPARRKPSISRRSMMPT